MSDSHLKRYLRELQSTAQRGDAREESFYPALEALLRAVAGQLGANKAHITTLPRPTDAGNPDFRVWDGTNRITGYLEAKRPESEDLNRIEESEQLQRYRTTFPNLILTNFLEFRLYRDGQLIDSVIIGRPAILNQLRAIPPLEQADNLLILLQRFFDFSLPQAFTAASLATELARRTRFLRDIIEQQLTEEQQQPGVLSGFYQAFQTYLIGTITATEFADLFAQTITYGLFAARTRAKQEFSRRAAFDNIPHTIGILRDLFRFISLGDLPEELAWSVDDVVEVLAVADLPGILDRYYQEGKGNDPIVHFYETFLACYDPAEREKRGVYYTPEPVVGYIVRSLHNILKKEFGELDGLASEGVTLLDPAAGTMTFIAQAVKAAVSEFEAKYGTGGCSNFIRSHILKNFFAFELMMAPYAVGHLKMSFLLEELGHRLADNERMSFYLTNSLDNDELSQSYLPGLVSLAEESRLASNVKRQTPVLVILGNPPYSGHSSNRGEWIQQLINDYKSVDGQPLGERNPKWLQDDYVKFIRFAQWKIESAGHGIVGMITNHGYLDNPTFRGMRRSLMQTFDAIYLLDLHGNSLKREVAPDGAPDQNVFDIRQGVAIAFFIKRRRKSTPPARIYHADCYGTRQHKYEWLDSHSTTTTDWARLKPQPASYLFVPRDNEALATYEKYPSITTIFPVNSVGIVTARDALTIQHTAADVWRTVTLFAKMEAEVARQSYNLGKDSQDWQVKLAQQDLLDSGPERDKVVPILYRPFDIRYTYYTGKAGGFLCRPRPEVMQHMLAGENLALAAVRQVKASTTWQHCWVADMLSESCLVSNKTSEISYTFPLYLYPKTEPEPKVKHNSGIGHYMPMLLFEAQASYEGRKPNLNPDIVTALTGAHGQAASPEAIFHYIYALLHAPAYRARYATFLKLDFPRIPFTTDRKLFKQLTKLGEKLTALHLLKATALNPPLCRFEGAGDSRVAKNSREGLRYDAEAETLWINATQYFSPLPEATWNYQIGGYQVCDKWLKDRRERRLDLAETQTFCRIVTALSHTLRLQNEIDVLYEQVETETMQ